MRAGTVFTEWVGLNCACRDCVYRVGGPEPSLHGFYYTVIGLQFAFGGIFAGRVLRNVLGLCFQGVL